MKKIVMAGNTHFDPVWLWRWDEGMASILATFRSALERMKEYDDFTYSFSAPAVLEWVRKTDPEMWDEIKTRIAEGRWELCEGWWLQADCNAALGESYVRQGLYAQNYFREHFGKMSDTVFNIDSFGHPATLPQILAGCGIKNYVFWRPNEEQRHLESPLFRWKGENGTSVLTYRIGGEGGEIFTPDILRDTLDPLIENANGTGPDRLVVYGVTDHGGAPTVEMIEKIHEKAREVGDTVAVSLGRVSDYFRMVGDDTMPEVRGEIQVNFIGPYSNFTEIKKNNRRCEYAAMNAEKASVIVEKLTGEAYPSQKIREIWQDILFNQFHDILGGCCIESAYRDARDLHGRAAQNAAELLQFSLRKIIRRIAMPGHNPDNAWNLVVWNLNGFPVETEIEAEVQWAWEFDWYRDGIELCDGEGNVYPCQIIREQCVLPGFRSRFVFKASLPSLGYKTFIVKQTKKTAAIKTNDFAENRRFAIKRDENGGVSLCDKLSGTPLFTAFFRPYVLRDECDTWGFNKTVYESEKQFLSLSSFEVVESGAIRTTVRLVWRYQSSSVEQLICLYDTHIDCTYRVMWCEERCALKFGLTDGRPLRTFVSAPYGCVGREACQYERPMGEWLRGQNDEHDFTVSSDSVFAYQFDGSSLGFTILRNAVFGDLRTEELDPARHYRYMGQGICEGTLRVSFTDAPDKEGILLNNPPLVICEANHGGDLPGEQSFFETDGEALLTTLKKAEDENGYVMRLYQPAESVDNSTVRLFSGKGSLSMKKGEVAAFRTADGCFIKTDFLEQPKDTEN